jgi:hypothetical protein
MAQARITQRETCDLPGTLLDIYQFVPAQKEQDSLRLTQSINCLELKIKTIHSRISPSGWM